MATYGPEKFKAKSGRELTIRHREARDLDAFFVFQPQVASETTHTLQMVGRMPERNKVEAAWLAASQDEIALYIGVFDGARMIADLGFQPERQPPHPWTRHMARFGMMVLQEYWGEGVARRLLEIMEAHARTHGITRIEAMVRTQNDRGIKLYRRMGYDIEGTRRKAAFINGQYQDEFFISKILSTAPWQPPKLKTPRLVLRGLELGDAPAIFEYARNPNVSRYTLWEPHVTVKDSEAYVLDYAQPKYRQEVPEPLGIALASNPGKIIGTVGLFWASQKSKCMELAYAIGEPYWGQGLVAEAARAVMSYAFDTIDVVRIQAHCKAENLGSARVMEKLGMRYEGTFRSALLHHERYWDMRFYAVLKEEWGSSRSG